MLDSPLQYALDKTSLAGIALSPQCSQLGSQPSGYTYVINSIFSTKYHKICDDKCVIST